MSLPPGSSIGILGGGQLGRMIALAAAPLGYRCVIFAPEENAPACDVTASTFCADYADEKALAAFAADVDVVTIEFENVPCQSLRYLAKHVPVWPSDTVLEITQDRDREKKFLRSIDVAVAPFGSITSEQQLRRTLQTVTPPAILKTCRLGYDGKGQIDVDAACDLSAVWRQLNTGHAILEKRIDFSCEISVITARSCSGAIRSFAPVQNIHENHILKRTLAPASIPAGVATKATEMAERIAQALDLVGLIAVEMFLLESGELLVNELAPRPHNSGHWTIDGCKTSQFEQVVRAVCDLPLGDTTPIGPAEMVNLLGDEWLAWPDLLMDPDVRLHLYGKQVSRPGRKMGHYTKVNYT